MELPPVGTMQTDTQSGAPPASAFTNVAPIENSISFPAPNIDTTNLVYSNHKAPRRQASYVAHHPAPTPLPPPLPSICQPSHERDNFNIEWAKTLFRTITATTSIQRSLISGEESELGYYFTSFGQELLMIVIPRQSVVYNHQTTFNEKGTQCNFFSIDKTLICILYHDLIVSGDIQHSRALWPLIYRNAVMTMMNHQLRQQRYQFSSLSILTVFHLKTLTDGNYAGDVFLENVKKALPEKEVEWLRHARGSAESLTIST